MPLPSVSSGHSFSQHPMARRERKEKDRSERVKPEASSPLQSEEASNWAVAEIIMLTFDCKFKQIEQNILECHKISCALGNVMEPENKIELSHRKWKGYNSLPLSGDAWIYTWSTMFIFVKSSCSPSGWRQYGKTLLPTTEKSIWGMISRC